MRPVKPYSDFPLFPAANGQWCKKINKQPFYFGSWKADPKGEAAVKDWLARQDAIRAGVDKLRVVSHTASYTLGRLKDEFIAFKRVQTQAHDLSPRTLADYQTELGLLAETMGQEAKIASLRPEHFAAYHEALITKRHLGRHARKRTIAYIKAMFNWGAVNGKFPLPAFGSGFDPPDTSLDAMRQHKAREGRPDYSERIVTGEEIEKMIKASSVNMRAVILLGINCGIGPADIGRLKWSDFSMTTGRLQHIRGKTGCERHGYLWKRTRQALEAVKRLKRSDDDSLVFRSKFGNPLYMEIKSGDTIQGTKVISKYIYCLTRRLKLSGITHYRLRHTFATLGKKAHDKEALNAMMGHADRTIGATYTQGWEIEFHRIKRVSKIVYRSLWPKPKELAVKQAA